MPLFNVIFLRKVTKFNEDRTESHVVDRIVVAVNNIVAVDGPTACVIAGRQIPADLTDEDLSLASAKVVTV